MAPTVRYLEQGLCGLFFAESPAPGTTPDTLQVLSAYLIESVTAAHFTGGGPEASSHLGEPGSPTPRAVHPLVCLYTHPCNVYKASAKCQAPNAGNMTESRAGKVLTLMDFAF